MLNKEKVVIGSGAGFSGDRIEPAVELAEKGNIDYLIFECLAERTIALSKAGKDRDADLVFDPFLEERMIACLPVCCHKGIKIITNMGAANPLAAARRTAEIARDSGFRKIKVAAVTGDDVCGIISEGEHTVLETGEKLSDYRRRIVSANAYVGYEPVKEALDNGADVVITGRISDPSLFLAAVMHEFGFGAGDYDMIGKLTVMGHMLESAGQVTGGYFSDPGLKDVPNLARLGFPIAEVNRDGSFIITKVPHSGGMVTMQTCKEQLLYRISNPSGYITPDVVADFSTVKMIQEGKDRVLVTGGSGRKKTGMLKVSIGCRDGYIGEGQISYGGPGAVERARLAIEIVKQRLKDTGVVCNDTCFDIIGVNSLYGDAFARCDAFEVRARVAARTMTMKEAIRVGNEVETLYTNGPAGGGGASKSAREAIAMLSVLIDSELVKPKVHYINL
jgi:hypothetical protein